MGELDTIQTRIMVAIVAAHQHRGEGGRRYPMHHIRAGGMQEHVQHVAWPEDMAGVHVGREDLEYLEALGALDIERLRTWWKVAPTPEGIAAVAEYHQNVAAAELEEQLEDIAALSTDWSVVGPIAEAVVRGAELQWQHGGVTFDELRDKLLEPQHVGLSARLEALERGDWIERVPSAQPRRYRPTEKALQSYRRWPAHAEETIGEALLQQITAALEMEQTPETRTKFEALRDVGVDLGAKTLGELVARAGGIG